MSFQDFERGRTAQQIAKERELHRLAEEEASQAEEDELVSILRPLTTEEMFPAELTQRKFWTGVR